MKEDKRAKLLEIAKIAANYSGGRLRLAHQETDDGKVLNLNSEHFLKLDGKRFGQDIEYYGFWGDATPGGWPEALAMFLREIVFPLKTELPKSFNKAGKELLLFGETVYPKSLLFEWRGFFNS